MKEKLGDMVIQFGLNEEKDTVNEYAVFSQSQQAKSQPETEQKITCSKMDSVIIGKLVSFDEKSQPLIDYFGNPYGRPLLSKTVICLSDKDIETDIVLLFENANPFKPIIMGVLCESISKSEVKTKSKMKFESDDDKLVFKAHKEITLQCGDASITLKEDGKIIIRGAHLVSRSSGVNRIKGGTVQIN